LNSSKIRNVIFNDVKKYNIGGRSKTCELQQFGSACRSGIFGNKKFGGLGNGLAILLVLFYSYLTLMG
jgi:hypothetical protein